MDRDLKEVHPKIIQALLDADSDITVEDALENEMVLNMGPQHPATHGVLRLVLRLDGETVVACVPELGYLHRGYEKLAENMTYYEFIPDTDDPGEDDIRFALSGNFCRCTGYNKILDAVSDAAQVLRQEAEIQ